MAIKLVKPPIKETVGAMYVCFANMTNGEFDGTYESDVEKSEVVKSASVSENMDQADVYASGKAYDNANKITYVDISTDVIAFYESTRAKMRGDTVDSTTGLVLSGGGERPFFAYGKVVKYKGGKDRYEWFPKCKLVENSDEASTSEETFSEQTDSLTIRAYPFDDAGNIKSMLTYDNMPEGMTEDKFFAKPVLTAADLT